MPAAIKLMRIGKRSNPSYRIVVLDRRSKRTTNYLDQIGTYNPVSNPPSLKIDQVKLNLWLDRGAVLTEGTAKLKLRKADVKKD